tara:strand:+ start:433 stop:612 length:180 start_codon:yes stop_codon:yes gene_type:complete
MSYKQSPFTYPGKSPLRKDDKKRINSNSSIKVNEKGDQYGFSKEMKELSKSSGQAKSKT